MLRITKVADYGFVLLIRMAGQHEPLALHNARDLARETNLPLPMVSKILKALAKGGLLASHRGIKGGYSLARNPELITAAQIITTLDGPITVTECLSLQDLCGYETHCHAKSSWRRLNEAISGALDGITLAEMAQPSGCCGAGLNGDNVLNHNRYQNAKHAYQIAK